MSIRIHAAVGYGILFAGNEHLFAEKPADLAYRIGETPDSIPDLIDRQIAKAEADANPYHWSASMHTYAHWAELGHAERFANRAYNVVAFPAPYDGDPLGLLVLPPMIHDEWNQTGVLISALVGPSPKASMTPLPEREPLQPFQLWMTRKGERREYDPSAVFQGELVAGVPLGVQILCDALRLFKHADTWTQLRPYKAVWQA